MLRNVVFAAGCLLLVGALMAAHRHLLGLSFQLAVFGLVLAGGVAFERWRYKPAVKGRLGPNWQPTGERFVDPTTGKSMEVYFDPATGERRYVEADRRGR
jgi:hypothetical protein